MARGNGRPSPCSARKIVSPSSNRGRRARTGGVVSAALYVKIDDWIGESPASGPRRS
ncbi:hypothetical protein [Streptosporangium saharense]|uniref:hypothetical protein n=1 Tax=Streptosporangium saharense TaxID=1706840 RepID=UPI0034365E99